MARKEQLVYLNFRFSFGGTFCFIPYSLQSSRVLFWPVVYSLDLLSQSYVCFDLYII